MTAIKLRVFANADDVHLVWDHDEDIAGCVGFAIQCRRGEAAPKYLSNRVGFQDEQVGRPDREPVVMRSSQDWPFQRYDWTDHAADLGDVVAYRVVARVLEPGGALVDGPASDWSRALKLSPDCGDGVSVHFNRGFVLSQFMARYMKEKGITLAQLKKKAVVFSNDVDQDARAFLGGTLREAILKILGDVEADEDLEIRGALYELEDEELVQALARLGDRAQVVLANGSVDTRGDDQNKHARSLLKTAGLVIYDRFTSPQALGHNKFLVIGRSRQGKFRPEAVWTGSTNWTPTGLCTQLNNGILLENRALAARYLAQFELLAEAGDRVSPELLAFNNKPGRNLPLGAGTVDTWFSKLSGEVDIAELVSLVEGAKEGVLFVMFQPGSEPVRTLLRMQEEKGIYVRGVATRFTGEGAEMFRLLKQKPEEYFLDSAETTGVGRSVGAWAVEGTAGDFRKYVGQAITHSKVMVIDPFGETPVVVTGSHNFSKSASGKNDENFLVIRGHRAIAEHYAVNAIQTYNHYRWRAYLQESAQEGRQPWQHLARDPAWQRRRNQGESARMLKFWI